MSDTIRITAFRKLAINAAAGHYLHSVHAIDSGAADSGSCRMAGFADCAMPSHRRNC